MTNESLIWLAFSIVVVAVVAALWLRKRLRLRRALSWPTVPGRVESSAVRLERRGENQHIYVAEVRYAYTAAGQACTGSLRHNFMLKGSADRWVGGFANSEPLVVRYNERDANDSVLLERDQTASAATASR